MNEILMKRIARRLANLPDEQGYQVLDYVEFLEQKYGTGETKPSVIDRIAEGVEDTMRAGRLPVAAIRGTMSAMDSASRALEKLAGAGRAAVEELGKAVAPPPSTDPEAPGQAPSEASADAEPPPKAAGDTEEGASA